MQTTISEMIKSGIRCFMWKKIPLNPPFSKGEAGLPPFLKEGRGGF
jgi:hypothetical protein